MATKRTLVEIEHCFCEDEELLSQLNEALGDGRDMRVIEPYQLNADLLRCLTQLVSESGVMKLDEPKDSAFHIAWLEADRLLRKIGFEDGPPSGKPAAEPARVPLEVPKPSEMTYGPEIWHVDKTVIYNAITAIASALTYLPHIKTEVPRFQRALLNDIDLMEGVVGELRKLESPESIARNAE